MAINTAVADTDLDDFILIWLDGAINEFENTYTQNALRQLTNQFKAFEKTSEFQSYIQSVSSDERIVLIVSGRIGREVMPWIDKNNQIYAVYVYCFDEKSNREWAKDYSKIKKVLTKKEVLIEQIRKDNKKEIEPINTDPLHINLDNQLIHSQILIDYLLKVKSNSTIDTTFFSLCKQEYATDSLQLQNLDEFQKNPLSKNILWWLIKDKFLWKLFITAFNTKNIDLLYSSRFLIQNLNQQLELNKCSTLIHVYHSHLMTEPEFQQLKNSIGKLVSMNTFILTTFQRNKALDSLKQTTNSHKVLFEIQADPSIEKIKPFADITSIIPSTKQPPPQILFMLGSIFRIKNFSQQNQIWICQMELSSRNDSDVKTIYEQIIKEDGDSETDLLSFGNILARIGQYDDAEKYYQHILQELTSNHEDTSICYRNLGNIAYLKKDYDKSLEYHLKSLEIKQNVLSPNDPSIADSYNCLGIVYFDKKDYKQAISSYEKALSLLQSSSDKNPTKQVVLLMNIGLVYRTECNYSKALHYYQQALNIVKERLSDDHSDLGQIYHNLGALYWCQGYYDDALKYYNLSLENKAKHLPPKHSFHAMTLENMGLIHENKQNYREAMNYYEKAFEIYQQTFISTDSDVIQIKSSISRVSSYLKS